MNTVNASIKFANPGIALVFSALFFSMSSATVKWISPFPIWEIIFIRSLFNVFWLLPWLQREGLPVSWRSDLKLVLPRGIFGCMALACSFASVVRIPVGESTMLYNTHPIISLGIGALIFKEAIGLGQFGGFSAALLGVVLILKPGMTALNPGGIFALFSAFFASIAHAFVKQATLRLPPQFVVLSFAAVTTLISAPLAVASWKVPTAAEAGLLLGIAFFSTIAQGLMTYGFSKLPIGIASPVLFTSVVFSALLGWFFFQEIPDSLSLLGGVLVGVGLWASFQFRPRIFRVSKL